MLSLEEWKTFSEGEKGERYRELSAHDRFLVRMGVGAPPPIAISTGMRIERTEEERKQSEKDLERLIKEFEEKNE